MTSPNPSDYYSDNVEHMYSVFLSLTSGTITPSTAATTLFTWLSDIISGTCPPFDIFNDPVPPGDTPRMEHFTAQFTSLLIAVAQNSSHDVHEPLLELAIEFYSLLRGKPWVSRGETMENPTLGMLLGLGNSHPSAIYNDECEDQELIASIPRRIISRVRFLALLENRLGFDWLRETLVLEMHWGLRGNASNVAACAEILEIAGEDLFMGGETYGGVEQDTWGVYHGSEGYCVQHWEGWMDVLRAVAVDEGSTEEERSAAGRAVGIMAGVKERCGR